MADDETSARPSKRARPLPAAAPPARAHRVAGKFFIVTGGTQGCGECIARTLADEGAAGITICGRQEAKGVAVAAALEAKGCKAEYVRADLSNASDCAAVVARHDAVFGKCDGLINCAAMTSRGTWEDTTPELFDRVYALNVRAPFLLMQATVRLMEREGSGGSIVNIGSVHCHGGMPKLVAYASSKSALLGMTKNLAHAKRGAGIRANYIAVGWMSTPAEHDTQLAEGKPADWLKAADAQHHFGRILRPWDIAKQTAHLLSDDGAMMSGECINLHEKFFGCWE